MEEDDGILNTFSDKFISSEILRKQKVRDGT